MTISKTFDGMSWMKSLCPPNFSFYIGVSYNNIDTPTLREGIETLLDYYFAFGEYTFEVEHEDVLIERHGRPLGFIHIGDRGLIRRLENPLRTRPTTYIEIRVVRK